MKIILLVLLSTSFILTINARLIEKITDRTLTTETKTTGSSPPIRLTRDVYEEDGVTGFSKEENVQSDEYTRGYNRRTRHFFKVKPKTDVSTVIRVPRESHEKTEKTTKNTSTTPSVPVTKTKATLVKKPIPKYNEMDYDDDFQMKISRSPVRVVDSGEHEDEDFNLDDYDFDVNHDEFIGRGKPLEPRIKHKEIIQERTHHPAMKHEIKSAPPPEVKMQSKVVSPATHRPVSNKKERAVDSVARKPGEKDDYYDDSTTTKAPEKEKARDLDDEFNEDNEESKEYEGKLSSVRMIRSPWKINAYVDKLGEKTSSVMTKVLSILPMFPQVPNKNTDEDINGPEMDPWAGRS